jgi:hypothetical protein
VKQLLAALALAGLLTGCIGISQERVSGSGDVTARSRAAGSFHKVVVLGSTDVRVTVAPAASIIIEAQPNIDELIETTVADGTLTIDEKKPYTTNKSVLVRVTTPSLDGLSIRGSSNATVSKVSGSRLALSIAGAGNLEGSGKVDQLNLDCSGAGNAELRDLEARDVVVRLSGVGNARLNVTGTLDVTIYGVGSVTYHGSPRIVHQEIRGVGNLSRD